MEDSIMLIIAGLVGMVVGGTVGFAACAMLVIGRDNE